MNCTFPSSPTGGRCPSLGVFSPDRTPAPTQDRTPAATPRVGAVRRLGETVEDVLDRAVRAGRVVPLSVPVQCGRCGDDLDGCMLVVRDYDDRYREFFDTVIEDVGTGDGPTVMQCDVCQRQLAADTVVLRERVVA